LEVFADVLGPTCRIGRTNRLVRILSILRFSVGIETRAVWQVLLSVHHLDVVAGLNRRRRGNASRVGAHVGDEPHRALVANLHAFVEVLCEPHRALGTEAELLGGVLLERAGGERRRRILSALATLYFRDLESLAGLERGENGVRLFLVVDDRLLAVEQMQLGSELLSVFLEQRFDGPVLDWLERADLALSFNEQTQRNGLDASR